MYRVGLMQFRPRFGNPEANLETVLNSLRKVRADLMVLPELPFTGYYFRNRAEAMSMAEAPRRSRIVEALVALCRDRHLHLVTGFLERDGDRCYNSSLLLGPRGIRQTYRKIHLFWNEKSWFDPGDRPLQVRRAGGVRIGMMVCFDWVFPEAARTLALQGMEVLCHPSNLVLPRQCQSAMPVRCVENAVFAVTANRHGADRRPHGTLRFTGRSLIAGPDGRVLYQGPAARPVVHVEPIDPSRARNKRITPRNHLFTDRRPEFYSRT
jgi:predicted amidohydrolase